MAKKKIKTINDLRDEIKRIADKKMVRIAAKIRDDLTETAGSAIQAFYNNYRPGSDGEPLYYQRHYWNFEEHSFQKYYAHSLSSDIYYGGVRLTPELMYDVYREDTFEVFTSVYSGYHGPKELYNSYTKRIPPIMSPSPRERIILRRDEIKRQLENHTYDIDV